MPAPGDAVRVEMTKWRDRPHWENDAVFLGSDRWGDWLGIPAGTHCSRPGVAFDTQVDSVSLVPHAGWWVATFYRPGIWVSTYVDIASPPTWDGGVARSVDLDLDVVRRSDGTVYLDDEDEFDEHRVTYAYPDHVVRSAREAGDSVLDAVMNERAPFDGSAQSWLAALDRV